MYLSDELDKALEIAKATNIKGVEARIYWRKAKIIEENPASTSQDREEMRQLRQTSTDLKRKVEETLKLTDLDLDSTSPLSPDKEQEELDRLVPGFYQ